MTARAAGGEQGSSVPVTEPRGAAHADAGPPFRGGGGRELDVVATEAGTGGGHLLSPHTGRRHELGDRRPPTDTPGERHLTGGRPGRMLAAFKRAL